MAEYRRGNKIESQIRKVSSGHVVSDITLKRGIVSSTIFTEWISNARKNGPVEKKTITLTLQDEARTAIKSWVLHGTTPMKYTGPELAAERGFDVAIEELVLSVEALEIEV